MSMSTGILGQAQKDLYDGKIDEVEPRNGP